MKGQYISLATSIALLAIFSACQEPTINRSEEGVIFLGSDESSDVVERVISPGQRTVVLNGFAGSINLVGSDSDVARFTITRTARGDSPAEAQSQLRNLDIEEVGDELTYRYNFTASQNALSRFDVTGTVPAGTPITIQWVAGNITIDGLSEKVEVQNQHGDVGYFGPSSTVRLRTRNGSAAATLTSTTKTFDVALLTANGDVTAHVSRLASGNIEANDLGRCGQHRLNRLRFGIVFSCGCRRPISRTTWTGCRPDLPRDAARIGPRKCVCCPCRDACRGC